MEAYSISTDEAADIVSDIYDLLSGLTVDEAVLILSYVVAGVGRSFAEGDEGVLDAYYDAIIATMDSAHAIQEGATVEVEDEDDAEAEDSDADEESDEFVEVQDGLFEVLGDMDDEEALEHLAFAAAAIISKTAGAEREELIEFLAEEVDEDIALHDEAAEVEAVAEEEDRIDEVTDTAIHVRQLLTGMDLNEVLALLTTVVDDFVDGVDDETAEAFVVRLADHLLA